MTVSMNFGESDTHQIRGTSTFPYMTMICINAGGLGIYRTYGRYWNRTSSDLFYFILFYYWYFLKLRYIYNRRFHKDDKVLHNVLRGILPDMRDVPVSQGFSWGVIATWWQLRYDVGIRSDCMVDLSRVCILAQVRVKRVLLEGLGYEFFRTCFSHNFSWLLHIYIMTYMIISYSYLTCTTDGSWE